ncbi:flagellar basal body rod protein FlgB [Anaeroselena agilis]|uniref:Flagellar basal body rod protein FlgB n=1 Tax=Anaeroselena agilis TaxID=3063788 RepID=A0ABU3NXZ5_9FIRM|nr:flagellar basal body rod protein FlgB [Selenomonadales bacterium 4137-cl]
MVKSILSSPQESVLERALGAAALRHKVVANNIANVNTPGFKRSDVVFEDKLAEAMSGGKLPLARTHAKHLAGRQGGDVSAPSVVTDTRTTMRTDGNNVDIDAEMANVAKNSIYYNAVAQQLGTYFSNLKSVIRGGN